MISAHKTIITWFDKERFDMVESGKFLALRNIQIWGKLFDLRNKVLRFGYLLRHNGRLLSSPPLQPF